jgi:hypothetical protein
MVSLHLVGKHLSLSLVAGTQILTQLQGEFQSQQNMFTNHMIPINIIPNHTLHSQDLTIQKNTLHSATLMFLVCELMKPLLMTWCLSLCPQTGLIPRLQLAHKGVRTGQDVAMATIL